MNQRIPTDLRNILATLYPDERSIRRVVDDSGGDSSKMVIDAHAMNSWHSVLSESEKNHQVEALLKAVESEYGNNQAFRSAYHAYRQATNGSIGIDLVSKTRANHPKIQGDPQRQWFLAAIIGLLLIAIVSGGWYWGIFGLDNLAINIPTAGTPIAPDIDVTEAQLAGMSSVRSTISPPLDRDTATPTQAPAFSPTSSPKLSTSISAVTLISLPTSSLTPLSEIIPTPTSTITHPCEAEIISTTGSQSVNTLRAKPSATSSLRGAVAVGTKVLVTQKVEEVVTWYRATQMDGSPLGWIPAANLHLLTICPK